MTLHCSFFTKSKNKKRNRRIKIENKKDLKIRKVKWKRNKFTVFDSDNYLRSIVSSWKMDKQVKLSRI